MLINFSESILWQFRPCFWFIRIMSTSVYAGGRVEA